MPSCKSMIFADKKENRKMISRPNLRRGHHSLPRVTAGSCRHGRLLLLLLKVGSCSLSLLVSSHKLVKWFGPRL